MRISRIETIVAQHHLGEDKFAYSQAWYNSRTILMVKVHTDVGHVGWGESFGPALANRAIIDHVFTPMLIGRDPLDTGVIWEELYNKLRDNGYKGMHIEAISAIDIALWDLKGKMLNLPVYKLIGGARRERVLPYATGLYRRQLGAGPEPLCAEATGYVEQGFRAIKMKIGFGPDDDVSMVKAIRRTIGSDILLMVDANHAYTANEAIHLSRRLEEFDIFWFEEPVPPEDIDGYAEVKARSRISIAGGEAELTSYGFHSLLEKRAVDIVQPDCCASGGISEFQKIATLASLHNIQCYPHVWGSAIAMKAGLHCALALPHYPGGLVQRPMLFEMDRTPNVFRERLCASGLPMKDGWIYPNEEPGLGLRVDEEWLEHYKLAD